MIKSRQSVGDQANSEVGRRSKLRLYAVGAGAGMTSQQFRDEGWFQRARDRQQEFIIWAEAGDGLQHRRQIHAHLFATALLAAVLLGGGLRFIPTSTSASAGSNSTACAAS